MNTRKYVGDKQLLFTWNQTDRDFQRNLCVHHLFEQAVKEYPERIAVEYEGQTLTYNELNKRANQLANYLQKLNVGPDVLVGVFMYRSIEMIIALLGVLKSGGAYVPIDPKYPFERIKYMLEDSKVQVLITEQKLKPLTGNVAYPIFVDLDWEQISHESDENCVSGVTPHHLAYVIYTSGSTGKPKGVLINHQGVVNHNLFVINYYNLTEQDTILHSSSISFDISVEEIFPTLQSGATLTLLPSSMIPSGKEFTEFIKKSGVTVLHLPTAIWSNWVQELNSMGQKIPESLRLVEIGGERVSTATYNLWRKLVGNRVRWINCYGPTEATVMATVYEPSEKSFQRKDVIPIGKPLPNTQIYILDSQLQPVPVGVVGEIYIGGIGLARGYLNQPEVSSQKFIANPYGEKGDRIYRTGDLARYRLDGNIEYIDRLDNQVKIRGYRIELGEIEHALIQHDCIQEAIVLLHEEDELTKYLVAYLVSSNETNSILSHQEVRRFLMDKIPEYMIPNYFIWLDNFPYTPNGKIDRSSLPLPLFPNRNSIINSSNIDVEVSRGEFEKTLGKIWCDVLRVDQISNSDNFFDLGGHSLLATKLVSRIRAEFKIDVSMRTVFDKPVFSDFVQELYNYRR